MGAGSTASPRVLLAEDDKLLRTMVVDSLLESGLTATVMPYADGGQVLAAVRKCWEANQPPHVVILDVVLPVMDGIEVALAIRREERAKGFSSIPLILMTAMDSMDGRLKSDFQHCQPAVFVHKGAYRDATELMKRLEKLVRSYVDR